MIDLRQVYVMIPPQALHRGSWCEPVHRGTNRGTGSQTTQTCPIRGGGMFTIRQEKRLAFPSADVWAAMDDFGAHQRFNPFIERSRITNGVPSGEGAERVIELYDGTVMRQRIVDYRPPRSMVIEVVETTQVIRHHLIEISVSPQGDGACVLAYTVSFRVPLGPLGYPLGVYQKAVLRSRYAHVLRGLERFLTTAEEADAVSRAAPR